MATNLVLSIFNYTKEKEGEKNKIENLLPREASEKGISDGYSWIEVAGYMLQGVELSLIHI